MADLDRYRCHCTACDCPNLTSARVCTRCTHGKHADDLYADRDPGDWEPHDGSEDP